MTTKHMTIRDSRTTNFDGVICAAIIAGAVTILHCLLSLTATGAL